MADLSRDPWSRLQRGLASGRVHSAYLFSGPGDAPRAAALRFARALVCTAAPDQAPCGACDPCHRSAPPEQDIALDGTGKKGPLLRHVGDHSDLLWIERGEDDTRVRIGQVRAVQSAFRLKSTEGGRRAAVIADAQWLNVEAQNALLRTLEEPPPDTTLILVTTSAAGLLTTVRSRCQRIVFRDEPSLALGADAPEEVRQMAQRLAALPQTSIPGVLDWAEEFRGPRAIAAAGLVELLHVASAFVHGEVVADARSGERDPQPGLDAFHELGECRKLLSQRNGNPQMLAERALLAVRAAGTR